MFLKSVAAAIAFGYSTALVLYGQLAILLVLAILGTGAFVIVEWKFKRQARVKQVSDTTSSEGSITEKNPI